MCRNIKTLFNFEPPATDEEIRAASLQFVRKLSGFNKPSLANAAAFAQAVPRSALSIRKPCGLTTKTCPVPGTIANPGGGVIGLTIPQVPKAATKHVEKTFSGFGRRRW
jgi:hypothetical protein